MGFLKNLFGGGRQSSGGSARESFADALGNDAYLTDGLVKVNELILKLGRFYQAHSEANNEVLVKVASNLTAYSLALTNILGPKKGAVLAGAQTTELLRILKTDEILPGGVEADLKVALRRPQLRAEDAVNLFTRHLNMYFDVGSKLLLTREMKEKGFSDAMIDRAVSEDRPNVF